MHENVSSLIIPLVLILNILLSSQWAISTEGYYEDTVGVQRGTVWVQEESIKQHHIGILFSYLL